MKMTTKKTAAVGLAFVLAAGLTGTAATEDTFRLVHDLTSNTVVPYIADKKGFYEAGGIVVERRVTAPRTLIDELIGGTMDIISTRPGRGGATSRPVGWMSWQSR